MQNIIPISSFVDPSPKWGGKANGLIKLARAKVKIPETWIISSGIDEVQVRTWAEQVHKTAWPPAMYGTPMFAVRSSASNEDGAALSYAGQYLTRLNVARNDVWDAVQEVRASAKQDHAYRTELEGERAGDTQMTVIVQFMVKAEIAGVLFRGDPYTGNREGNILEYVEGLADKLVGGEQAPKATIRWTNNNPRTLIKAAPMPLSVLQNMMDHTTRLSEKAGGDFEWVYGTTTSGDPRSLYFVQYRPLTNVVWGTGGGGNLSIGDHDPVTGVVARLPGKAVKKGQILVARMTTPDMIDSMIKASAIVTEIGGLTCHAAIIARELNKPCIVGYKEAAYLCTGDVVTVDVRQGVVYDRSL